MALHIIIDGYNLIGVSAGMAGDIEKQREMLIKDLQSYKRVKGARITVVFDGTGGINMSRAREVKDGVEVIFSRSGETADDVLKEYAVMLRQGMTLVTSDREVKEFAVEKGAVVVSSGEFLSLLEMARYADIKGGEDEEEVKPKKGQARRLPKKERLKSRRLKKL